jgi:hypothetical protein
MKSLAALAFLVTFALAAPAEVLVYKQNYTTTETGGGYVNLVKYGGYFIIDTDANRIVQVDARANTFPLGKNKMRVTEYTGWTFEKVNGGAVKDYWLLTGPVPGNSYSSPLLKGLVVQLVEVGSPNQLINWMNIPKTFTVSGFSKAQNTGGQTILLEYKGTMTLDLPTTQSQNRAGNDADAAIAAVKSILAAKGYVLVTNWND